MLLQDWLARPRKLSLRSEPDRFRVLSSPSRTRANTNSRSRAPALTDHVCSVKHGVPDGHPRPLGTPQRWRPTCPKNTTQGWSCWNDGRGVVASLSKRNVSHTATFRFGNISLRRNRPSLRFLFLRHRAYQTHRTSRSRLSPQGVRQRDQAQGSLAWRRNPRLFPKKHAFSSRRPSSGWVASFFRKAFDVTFTRFLNPESKAASSFAHCPIFSGRNIV